MRDAIFIWTTIGVVWVVGCCLFGLWKIRRYRETMRRLRHR